MTDNEAKMLNSERKIALITGGSIRIGKAISEYLLKRGWFVIVHYNKSRQEAGELALKNKNVMEIEHCDFTMPSSIKTFFENLAEKHGRISLLINNASSFINDSIDNITPDTFGHNISVNSVAPLLLTKFFASQGHFNNDVPGYVINLLDHTIKPNSDSFTSYSLSKNILETTTKMMAEEFAPKVLINGIALGMVMRGTRESEKHFEELCKQSLLKRPVAISDLESTIEYIINNRSLTGEIIHLTCGLPQ